MIVISLTSCPAALRGDLTAWLQEIDVCVFVGQVSARVREELWDRVVKNVRQGRATMVYTARGEQGMDFRVHNAQWEPIDFDGLKLMLRPGFNRQARRKPSVELPAGFSKAAQYEKARHFAGKPKAAAPSFPDRYLVVDVETTGLSAGTDHIIEIGALVVHSSEIRSQFQSFIRTPISLPKSIVSLTGITDQILTEQGKELSEVMRAFISFARDYTIVSHQIGFDLGFLRSACNRTGLQLPANPCVDTCALARRLVKEARDWKLSTLAEHFDIRITESHRSLPDCIATMQLFDKLIQLSESAL